jgi:hypothetical protein
MLIGLTGNNCEARKSLWCSFLLVMCVTVSAIPCVLPCITVLFSTSYCALSCVRAMCPCVVLYARLTVFLVCVQKWLAIGTFVTSWLVAKKDADAPPPNNNNGLATTTQHPPSQAFLTSLMQTFPLLFVNIKSRFVADDLRQLSTILQRVLVVPVSTDSTPFLLPVGVEAEVTPLQQALLGAFNALEKVCLYCVFVIHVPTLCPTSLHNG